MVLGILVVEIVNVCWVKYIVSGLYHERVKSLKTSILVVNLNIFLIHAERFVFYIFLT